MRLSSLAVTVAITSAIIGCHRAERSAKSGSTAEADFRALRDGYQAKFEPLFIAQSQAWWDANTSGKDEDFARKIELDKKMVELHSDHATFARLKALVDGGKVKDPVLSRELDVMYRSFLPGQANPELQKKIVALESEVEQTFNTHRSMVNGQSMTENDVRKVLAETKDSQAAEAAWNGYMEVGLKVNPKLKELVHLRNQLARELGFRDYFAMRLSLQEIDEKDLFRIYDELDALTAKPFAQVKAEIDSAMSKRFNVATGELRPWHFGDLFFQEAPGIEAVNLDDVYKDVDLLALTKKYYSSLGLESEAILARSDLYEKPGKSPHAFSTSIDRRQNIRVLCNMKNNAYWADTLVHELGHAVYDQYIADDVPFLLREPAHSLTTEGYAMLMGAMIKNQEFLTKGVNLPAAKVNDVVASARRSLRSEKLLFARWSQVMTRFEKGMYANPDQDLGKLWWDLKAKYQLLPPPANPSARADYAAKIHVVSAPVYYHSYMLGDLFACQVHEHIARKVVGARDPLSTCFWGSKEAGDYMKREIFGPGSLYPWNDLTKRATGERLSAKYFAKQYVN